MFVSLTPHVFLVILSGIMYYIITVMPTVWLVYMTDSGLLLFAFNIVFILAVW